MEDFYICVSMSSELSNFSHISILLFFLGLLACMPAGCRCSNVYEVQYYNGYFGGGWSVQLYSSYTKVIIRKMFVFGRSDICYSSAIFITNLHFKYTS